MRPDLARYASRGWSHVGTRLPCPDAQTSVEPFYDENRALKRLYRDEFVISMDRADYMP
jgi:hypothetical protein